MKIIVDSCVDFNEILLPSDNQIARVPFKITIDGIDFVDDGKTVVDELVKRHYQSKTIKTACPSPGDFYAAMKGAAESFVVTISSKLSGAYQSAKSAISMLKEEYGTEKIHIFDSKSASAGENLITLKIEELIASNNTFAQIVEKTEAYINTIKTFFALESLDTLVSNGRVSKGQQLASKAFKIFPIMGEDGNGKIEMKGVVRGSQNVIPKLIATIGKDCESFKEKILAITHVNAPEKANQIKDSLGKTHSFKAIHIFEASGLSSVYASNGGVILAY